MTDVRGDWLSWIDLQLRAAGTPEPSEAVKRRTVNQLIADFGDTTKRSESTATRAMTKLAESMQQVVATLVYQPDQAAVGLRSVANDVGSPRLMVWETDTHSVSVTFDREPAGRVSIRGQVAPRRGQKLESGDVVLVQDERSTTTELSAAGQFSFAGATEEPLRFEVRLGDTCVLLGPVELPPA